MQALNEEKWANLIDSRYEIIRLDKDGPRECDWSFLSPEFLATAARGSVAIGEATFGVPDTAESAISFRSKALVVAIAAGSGRIFRPFTGQLERIYASLGREWDFLTHGGRYCLASQMGDTMTAVDVETVCAFPQEFLILDVADYLSEAEIRRTSLKRTRAHRRCDVSKQRLDEAIGRLAPGAGWIDWTGRPR